MKIKTIIFGLSVFCFCMISNLAFSQNESPMSATDSMEIEEIAALERGEIFTIVEDMPSFPGGDDEMKSFIKSNLIYPKKAINKEIEGIVYVNFIINKNGSISDVKLLRGIGAGCDEEAIRVIEAMPIWKAGKQRGKLTRVTYNLPIRFALPD